MIIDPSIFRDYDIRAIANQQLDEDGVRRIAEAIVKFFKPKSIQVGRDMRVTSPVFQKAFIETMLDCGVNVTDLGFVSTDMLYFASGIYPEDMALTISASHNPPEFNGMKMVKRGAIAISGDSGIYNIRDLALNGEDLGVKSETKGVLSKRDIMAGWVTHLLKFIDVTKMKNFNVVSDTGNGMAGYFMPHLEEKLPWKVTRLFYDLDGTFPNHVPSPIEEKNRLDCINKVKETGADFGVVFDGDGDRVFMIDEKGRTLSGTIMTAIIAENLLQKNPNATILYNAIVGRVVPEIIKKNGGKPERVRVGHTLIKEAMRKFDGLFCGEHSGHYFFKANFYADSAIIAALLVAELMSIKNKKLSEFYDEYDKYPASGEINFEVKDKDKVIKEIEAEFKEKADSIDWLDGVSIWFKDYWLNVRPSNTESLLRLNVEADNTALLEEKTKELVATIEKLGGKEKI
jgi:phosphomannomutase